METIYLKEPFKAPIPCVTTIGMFDGVHLGHRFVIDCLRQEAARYGLPSSVITFDRHPRQVMHPDWQPQLLCTLDEKLMLLSQTGVDMCIVLPFTKSIGALSAHDFMHQVLQEQIGAKVLLTGYDNHFGHRSANKQEGFEDYKRYGEKIGMTVRELPQAPCQEGKEIINSSLIRRLLTEGKLEEANAALGRPYSVTGRVVSGEHIGTHLGFPTANLQPDDKAKLIPANGVYAVKVQLENMSEPKHGMTNIGRRPTFSPLAHHPSPVTIETHIFQHKGELYGQQMTISFVRSMRQEQPFESPEALKSQLLIDAATAEKLLTQDFDV